MCIQSTVHHCKHELYFQIRGKRGYIPKRLVKEMRVFVRHPTLTVPTELVQQTVMPEAEPQASKEQPVPTLLPEPAAQPPTLATQLPDEIKESKTEEALNEVPKQAVDEVIKEEPSDKNVEQVLIYLMKECQVLIVFYC